jgi:hypothetical protein
MTVKVLFPDESCFTGIDSIHSDETPHTVRSSHSGDSFLQPLVTASWALVPYRPELVATLALIIFEHIAVKYCKM